MNNNLKRHLPLGLFLVGEVLQVVGTCLSNRATYKNHDKINELKETKAKPKEYVKTLGKSYALSTAFTVGGAALSSGGIVLSMKNEQKAVAALVAIDGASKLYRASAKKLGVDKQIQSDMAKSKYAKERPSEVDGKKLYYEYHIGFFRATPEKFNEAILKLNRNFLADNCYSPYEMEYCVTLETFFLDWMDAEPLDPIAFNEYAEFGWNVDYLYEVWETAWIDVNTWRDGDTEYMNVTFNVDPFYNPEEPFNSDTYDSYIREQIRDFNRKENVNE